MSVASLLRSRSTLQTASVLQSAGPYPAEGSRVDTSWSASAGKLGWACAVEISYYNSLVEIHSSARKHGVGDEDIEHAVENAMSIDEQEDDTRLYLGPARPRNYLRWSPLLARTGRSL